MASSEAQGRIAKATGGTIVSSGTTAGGIQVTALDTMMHMADALAVIKVVVAAVIINPDQHEKQESGDEKPGDEKVESNSDHLQKQQRRPPGGDASLEKALGSASTPSFRLQELQLPQQAPPRRPSLQLPPRPPARLQRPEPLQLWRPSQGCSCGSCCSPHPRRGSAG